MGLQPLGCQRRRPRRPLLHTSSDGENYDDVDFDSIGLTDAEMEELPGETPHDDPLGDS